MKTAEEILNDNHLKDTERIRSISTPHFPLAFKNTALKSMEEYAEQRVEEYRRKTADIMEDTLTIDINKVVGKSRDRSIGYNKAIEFVVKSLRELPEPLPKAPTV